PTATPAAQPPPDRVSSRKENAPPRTKSPWAREMFRRILCVDLGDLGLIHERLRARTRQESTHEGVESRRAHGLLDVFAGHASQKLLSLLGEGSTGHEGDAKRTDETALFKGSVEAHARHQWHHEI